MTPIVSDFSGLHANSGEVELDITEPLDAIVNRLVIVGQHDEDELRCSLAYQLLEDPFYFFDRVIAKTVIALTRQSYLCIGSFFKRPDLHAALDAHRTEPVSDFPQRWVLGVSEIVSPAVLDDKHRPLVQPRTDSESDTSEVPRCTIVDGGGRGGGICQLGFVQDTTGHDHHLRSNADPKRIQHWVRITKPEHADTPVDDLVCILLGRLASYVEHRSGMFFVGEFSFEALVCEDVADFRGITAAVGALEE